jgi:iron-sulfur cluster assembly protein
MFASRGFISAFRQGDRSLDLSQGRERCYIESRSARRALNPAEPGVLRMGSVKPRFKVMSLTDAAATRVREIIDAAESPVAGLRVGVKNGGCAGMSYTMDWAKEIGPHDEVIEDKGVKVLIDPKAVLFLLGTEMDFETTKLSSGFVFKNPNQTSACGCGESVAIEPAKPEDVEAAR